MSQIVLLGAIIVDETLMMKNYVISIIRKSKGSGTPILDDRGIFLITPNCVKQ